MVCKEKPEERPLESNKPAGDRWMEKGAFPAKKDASPGEASKRNVRPEAKNHTVGQTRIALHRFETVTVRRVFPDGPEARRAGTPGSLGGSPFPSPAAA